MGGWVQFQRERTQHLATFDFTMKATVLQKLRQLEGWLFRRACCAREHVDCSTCGDGDDDADGTQDDCVKGMEGDGRVDAY